MGPARPTISVVVPTHNRQVSLRRMLDALEAQTYPIQQVEVVVVADGCTDGTMRMLQFYAAPFALRVTELPGLGCGAAKSHGAACATGPIVLFLDDDLEPTVSVIEAHMRAHREHSGQVVIGPSLPVIHDGDDWLRCELRNWWHAKFLPMAQSGHRYGYRDFVGGNLSLETDLFGRNGGFDPAFSLLCFEDYELGMRLLKAGIRFTFAPNALAHHHEYENVTLDSFLQRKYREGKADVLLGRSHPDLRSSLPLALFDGPWHSPDRILSSLAFAQPGLGDRMAVGLRSVLGPLEYAGQRRLWGLVYATLHRYHYWQGVAESLGTRQQLACFLRNGLTQTNGQGREIEIDLREGIEVAEQQIDDERPLGVCVRYGTHVIGCVPAEPGAEELRGAHLRPILAKDLAKPLLRALANEGVLDSSADQEQQLTTYLGRVFDRPSTL